MANIQLRCRAHNQYEAELLFGLDREPEAGMKDSLLVTRVSGDEIGPAAGIRPRTGTNGLLGRSLANCGLRP